MDIMASFKPDLILAVADGRVALGDGQKRVSKSVERTCNMIDICVKKLNASDSLKQSALIGELTIYFCKSIHFVSKLNWFFKTKHVIAVCLKCYYHNFFMCVVLSGSICILYQYVYK